MYIEIDKSTKNTGLVNDLIEYLEKENQEANNKEKEDFFSQDRDDITPDQAKEMINSNAKGFSNDRIKNGVLVRGDKKYFSIYIAPSEKELQHIGNDPSKLKSYIRELMESYAQNFGKGLTAHDLVYVAKVEHSRKMKGFDSQVQLGFAKQGDLKAGHNMHVHVIVSRRCKDNGGKISPLANEKKVTNVSIGNNKGKKGFNRKNWIIKGERIFDSMFDYSRALEETFEYRLENKAFKDRILDKSTDLDRKIYLNKQVDKVFESYDSHKNIEDVLNQNGITITETKNYIEFEFKPGVKQRIDPKSIVDSKRFTSSMQRNLFKAYPRMFKMVQALPYAYSLYKEAERVEKAINKEEEKEK